MSDDLWERVFQFLQETAVPEGAEPAATSQQGLQSLLDASCLITHEDAAALRRYFERMKLSEILGRSPNLRCHPGLLSSELNANGERAIVDPCPAILAPLSKLDGELVGVHALYLTQEGARAPLMKPEKTWIAEEFRPNVAATGVAVHLMRPGRALSVTLGLENGCAIAVASAQPVWVATCASMLESMQLPAWVREVHCWALRDSPQLQPDGTFRSPTLTAAQRLVRRLRNRGRAAQLILPSRGNVPWHELYREQGCAAFPLLHSLGSPLPSARRLTRDQPS